ncbi:MAG: hypothetical protein V1926_03685 [Candidatus Peregrinibacteria bacterium]
MRRGSDSRIPLQTALARQLDNHPQVDWWLRNVVHNPDGFRIQGFRRHAFYPDFIVRTKEKRWWILEYKGEQLVGSTDSDYKEAVGRIFVDTYGKSYHFHMVTGPTMKTVLEKIR